MQLGPWGEVAEDPFDFWPEPVKVCSQDSDIDATCPALHKAVLPSSRGFSLGSGRGLIDNPDLILCPKEDHDLGCEMGK